MIGFIARFIHGTLVWCVVLSPVIFIIWHITTLEPNTHFRNTCDDDGYRNMRMCD